MTREVDRETRPLASHYRDKDELKRAALLEVLAELIMKPIARP
jgi:hypothetical protein